jgi:glycosyltransferase involved in cell wall biosynthesis
LRRCGGSAWVCAVSTFSSVKPSAAALTGDGITEVTVLKIALVALNGDCATATGSRPGAENLEVHGLANAMAAQGHRVTVYARRSSRRQPAEVTLESGITVRYLHAGPPRKLTADQAGQHIRPFADALADGWRRDRPDVAHAWFWTSGLAALAGARDQRVPVVQTFYSLGAAEHRHHMPEHGPAGRIRLEASIGRTVSAVLAGSSEETTELATLGVPRTVVRVVPYGIDTTRFAPGGPVARRGRRPRLLVSSSLEPGQGLDTAILAMVKVPGAELVIVGGPDRRKLRDLGFYRTLTGLATSLGVRDRVSFTGRIHEADLPAWIRSADLMISPASYEPFGTATVRAMACGIPVIASSVGANQDAVIDGTTGVLVPPGQPRLLAQRIRDLLSAPVRRGAYGAAGADRASSRYSWERIGQETLTAYERSAERAAA